MESTQFQYLSEYGAPNEGTDPIGRITNESMNGLMLSNEIANMSNQNNKGEGGDDDALESLLLLLKSNQSKQQQHQQQVVSIAQPTDIIVQNQNQAVLNGNRTLDQLVRSSDGGNRQINAMYLCSIEELRKFFHLPIVEVAKQLGNSRVVEHFHDLLYHILYNIL